MTELILFGFIGIVLVVLFSVALLIGHSHQLEEAETTARLFEIVSLPGLRFKNAATLFDNSDYQILRRETAFKSVAWHLRHDRRKLVLLWLRLLRKDLLSLWRFRRMLANYGVSAGFAEELQVAITAIAGLVLLSCLRVIVTIAGPFALTGLLRSARADVEGLSRSCAFLLGRVPATRWSEIQHAWNAGQS
jgi:hypothetical protein